METLSDEHDDCAVGSSGSDDISRTVGNYRDHHHHDGHQDQGEDNSLLDFVVGRQVWHYGDLVMGTLSDEHDDCAVGSSGSGDTSHAVCICREHHHHNAHEDQGEDNSLLDLVVVRQVWRYGDLVMGTLSDEHDDCAVGSSGSDDISRAVCIYRDHHHHDGHETRRMTTASSTTWSGGKSGATGTW